MVVWKLIMPSWCPNTNADSILLRATQDMKRELNANCSLGDVKAIYSLMTTAFRSTREKNAELPGWGPEDWVKPGDCLAKIC